MNYGCYVGNFCRFQGTPILAILEKILTIFNQSIIYLLQLANILDPESHTPQNLCETSPTCPTQATASVPLLCVSQKRSDA